MQSGKGIYIRGAWVCGRTLQRRRGIALKILERAMYNVA